MNTTKKLYTILALVTGILLNLSSCKKDDDSPDEPKQITLTAELPLELEAGQTVKLKFAIKADSSEVEIHWKSSNEEVVSVQQDGTVTAALAGSADITASSSNDGGKTQVLYHVTVKEKSKMPEPEIKAHPESVPSVKAKVKPEQIMLTYKGLTIELDPGQTVKLQAYVSPEGAEQKVTYQSSDEKAAAVTQEGTVTAVAAGEAEITAASQSDKEVKAVCKVVVKEKKSEKAEPSTTLVDIPDENFRAYLKQEIPDAFPGGGDKMDSSSELVKNLKKIIVENKEIKSMKGIEYFTGLEELNCKFNQLTSLDVMHNTALTYLSLNHNSIEKLNVSNNKDLTDLYCNYNKLTELDVSQNKALKNLSCNKEYKFRKLDVTKNTALTALDCSRNKITELVTSNNIKLQRLYCSDNELTELDVSNNKNLIELQCQENQLDSLDLSHNPKLNKDNVQCDEGVKITWYGETAAKLVDIPDENFRAYLKQEIPDAFSEGGDKMDSSSELVKNLKKIIVEKKGIKSIKGIEYFTGLEELNCKSNYEIEKLDVSQNKNLKTLNCQSNKLTGIDVSNNPDLTELLCSNNHITELDLSHNPKLTILYCNFNELRELDVSNNPDLTELLCNNNHITELDLSNNPKLTRKTIMLGVDWKDVKITWYGETAAKLVDIPDENFRAYLKQEIPDAFPEGGDKMDSSSELVKNLKKIIVEEKEINSLEGIEYFIGLEELYCRKNHLVTLNVSQNTALKNFDCSQNNINELDVTKNTGLIKLLCFQNVLSELDVTKNIALTYLNCGNNYLGNLDVTNNKALEVLGCYMDQLKELDVTQNKDLKNLLCLYNDFTSLDLSHNPKLNKDNVQCDEGVKITWSK